MAVTSIWKIDGDVSGTIEYVMNPEKTANPKFGRIEAVLDYAENPAKTRLKYFVSSLNCNAEPAAAQMQTVKRQFAKEGGIVGFHAYQSFAASEVAPELCHEIGVKLARKMWGDRFQVVVTTHLDTDNFHNHFVVNSVSFADGKRYHSCRENTRKFRELSDELCHEYGLSVVEPRGKSLPHLSNKKRVNPARLRP
jgi:hypothetical protein